MKKIIWNSKTNEVVFEKDYQFITKIDNNSFDSDSKNFYMADEHGHIKITKDKYEYLSFYDKQIANKEGYFIHHFNLDEAIEYIADDMLSSNNDKESILMYAKVLSKIATLLDN